MTTCEACKYPNNFVDIEHRCCKCGNTTSVSTADLVAELRARGGFALAPDAPEVVAFKSAEDSEVSVASGAVLFVAAINFCRAAGVLEPKP